MPNCPSSSPGSAPCRLELQWRPSRWLLAALLILSLLAPLSVLGSELPRALAWPLALGAAGAGLAAAWREAGRAPRHLRLAATAPGADAGPHAGRDTLDGHWTLDDRDTLDDRELARFELAWRGPLAFAHLVYRDGRHERLVWWPDTLPAQRRRELRLAAAARHASRHARPMAP